MIDSFHRTVKSCTERKMNPYPHLLRTLMANHIVYCLNKKKADTSSIRVIPRRILCCNKLQRTVSGNLFSKFLQTMSIQHHKCDLMFILFLKILRDLLIRRPLLIKILFSAYRNLTFLTFQLLSHLHCLCELLSSHSCPAEHYYAFTSDYMIWNGCSIGSVSTSSTGSFFSKNCFISSIKIYSVP